MSDYFWRQVIPPTTEGRPDRTTISASEQTQIPIAQRSDDGDAIDLLLHDDKEYMEAVERDRTRPTFNREPDRTSTTPPKMTDHTVTDTPDGTFYRQSQQTHKRQPYRSAALPDGYDLESQRQLEYPDLQGGSNSWYDMNNIKKHAWNFGKSWLYHLVRGSGGVVGFGILLFVPLFTVVLLILGGLLWLVLRRVIPDMSHTPHIYMPAQQTMASTPPYALPYYHSMPSPPNIPSWHSTVQSPTTQSNQASPYAPTHIAPANYQLQPGAAASTMRADTTALLPRTTSCGLPGDSVSPTESTTGRVTQSSSTIVDATNGSDAENMQFAKRLAALRAQIDNTDDK